MQGIKEGFHIIKPGSALQPAEQHNHRSATCPEFRDKTECQILSEITEGHYKIVDHKPKIVSALGSIPKRNSDKIRLIHDGSLPIGKSMNSYAEKFEFHYQSLDEAVKMLTPQCFMAQLDLASAFRSVKIHEESIQATGLKWIFKGDCNPTYMVDTRLSFGASQSPYIFSTLTSKIRYMMAQRGFHRVCIYLDDFLCIEDTKERCIEALNTLIGLVRSLGFNINWSKVDGPSQHLTFLGIGIDSSTMTIKLTHKRIVEFQELLHQFAKRKRATRRQLQALAGKLNWSCQVVRGGRTFLRRILDTMNKLSHSSHKIRLDASFHQDIQWWITHMSTFNGIAAWPHSKPITNVYTDACNTGGGAIFQGDYCYVNWNLDHPQAGNLHINYKEAFTVILAAKRWAPLWLNKKIIIHTDSITAMSVLNKGTCHNDVVMEALRDLFWLSIKYNFELVAVHIRGIDNVTSDVVSRLHQPNYLAKLYGILHGLAEPSSLYHFLCTIPQHMSFKSYCFLSPHIRTCLAWLQSWTKCHPPIQI